LQTTQDVTERPIPALRQDITPRHWCKQSRDDRDHGSTRARHFGM